MHIQRRLRTTSGLAMSLAMLASLGLTAGAQDAPPAQQPPPVREAAVAQQATVEGLVTGRSGPSMSVRTADSPRLTVILSDTTKATEKGGFLGLDRKDLGIAALVPGLN